MSEQNTFFQQEILNKPLQKHGLLEEFNLPPKAIRFIRNNQRNIILGLLCLVLAIGGWSSYSYYLARQNDRAAALLAEAVGQDTAQRKVLLQKVLDDYGRTGSAIWAKVELGHLAFDAQQFDEAIKVYLEVRDGLAKSSPVLPLIQLNLAQAYENKDLLPDALAAYQRLAEIKGFAGEAYLAMGRIYELQKNLPQAKEMYGKLLADEGVSPAVKEMVQVKFDRL